MNGTPEQTTSFVLGVNGYHRNLFAHAALWGVAAICEQAGLRVLVSWDRKNFRPTVHGSPTKVAEAVREHATRLADRSSWLHANTMLSKRTMPTMTPGPVNLTAPDVIVLLRDRERVIDEHTIDWSSQQWWTGVGRPSTPVLVDERDGEPVYAVAKAGASPLIMQTARSGTDIIRSKMRPLADVVAGRSVQQVVDGLTGATSYDDLNKLPGHSESTTSVGLSGHTSVDSAQAWCALWGLGQTHCAPPQPAMSTQGEAVAWDRKSWTRAETPIHQWATKGLGGWFAAPVWHHPAPAAQIRRYLTLQLALAAATPGPIYDPGYAPDPHHPTRDIDATELLNMHHRLPDTITGLMRFNVALTDTGHAIERHALRGEAVPLGSSAIAAGVMSFHPD